MKVSRSLKTLACIATLLGSHVPSGSAQEECLRGVQSSVQTDAWQLIRNYFASLSFARPVSNAARERSRLTFLRGEILKFEGWKQKLIEIVEAHIRGSSGGGGVSDDLKLSNIPKALEEIERIINELNGLAQDGHLFAGEDSFKALMINFSAKRASTLCDLARQATSPTPDITVMTKLLTDLKNELRTISEAEEALGRFIKTFNP